MPTRPLRATAGFLPLLVFLAGVLGACPRPGGNEGLDAGALEDGGAADGGVAEGGFDPPLTPAPDPVRFRLTGSLAQGRLGHTATLLRDGRVLVVGGESVVDRAPTDSVEIYDPATETWTTTTPLPAPRSNHAALLLDDGRVLVVGGGKSAPIGAPAGLDVAASALAFDPSTSAWSVAGSLLEGRSHFQLSRLPSRRILVSGGGAGTHLHGATCNGYGVTDCGPLADALASAEILDPATGTSSSVAAMASARFMATITRLADGRVLVAGGADDTKASFATTEIFDEKTLGWSPGPALVSSDRFFHQAALLPSGRVLVGGGKKSNIRFLASVDVVDVLANRTAATSPLSLARTAATFTPLSSGRVLSVGGFECPYPSCGPTDVAELFDEPAGAWTRLAPLNEARASHTTTLLRDGRLLVVGGMGSQGDLASCELGVPAP